MHYYDIKYFYCKALVSGVYIAEKSNRFQELIYITLLFVFCKKK